MTVGLCIVSTLIYSGPSKLVAPVSAAHNSASLIHTMTYKYCRRYHKHIQVLVWDTLLDKHQMLSLQYFVYVRSETCRRISEPQRHVCHNWRNAFYTHWRTDVRRNRMLDEQLSSMTHDSFGCFGNVFCLYVPSKIFD